jgi:hypothetical protein
MATLISFPRNIGDYEPYAAAEVNLTPSSGSVVTSANEMTVVQLNTASKVAVTRSSVCTVRSAEASRIDILSSIGLIEIIIY